jgi:uncharacterized protein YndB with AHSA1/START domain
MKRNVVMERVYPFTPEQVWAALADSRALSEWLMENDFQPYVGHRFQFRTNPQWGFDGIVRCEVIAVDKPRRLAYTWQGGPMKKPTTVTWTLRPVPEGTHLRLEHTGFEGLAGVSFSLLLGSGWGRLLREVLPKYIERHATQP